MEYRVTHYALRYGGVQERMMYAGRSWLLAHVALMISALVCAGPLDMVALDRRRT